jgi:hypothetical protein
MFYNTDIWPVLLAVIGGMAALTVLVSLLIAAVPLPRRHRQQPTVIGAASRRHAGPGRHLPKAA